MKDNATLELESTLDEPMDCLVRFKELVMGRGYCDAKELKKLVCDWIDLNMVHSLT